MYRFILPLFVLVPHDSNVAVDTQVWFRSSKWISSVAGISKILCTSEVASAICENVKHLRLSLRSWRDFARECFCFGSEAVRGLVKSRVEFPPAQIRGVFLIIRSPVHANFGLAESTETSMEGKRFVFRMRRNA